MERIYAKLTPAQVAAIKQIAQAERRHPSDQIAILVEQALAKSTTPKERTVSVS